MTATTANTPTQTPALKISPTNSQLVNETEIITAGDETPDATKLGTKKTVAETEVWNIPANISSEYKSGFRRHSQYAGNTSGFQNKSFKKSEDNTNVNDDIFNNLVSLII